MLPTWSLTLSSHFFISSPRSPVHLFAFSLHLLKPSQSSSGIVAFVAAPAQTGCRCSKARLKQRMMSKQVQQTAGHQSMQQTARHEGLTVIVGAGFTSKSSIPDPRLHIQLCCTHAKSHRHRHTVPRIVCIFLPVISLLCCSGWKSSWAIGWLVKVATHCVSLLSDSATRKSLQLLATGHRLQTKVEQSQLASACLFFGNAVAQPTSAMTDFDSGIYARSRSGWGPTAGFRPIDKMKEHCARSISRVLPDPLTLRGRPAGSSAMPPSGTSHMYKSAEASVLRFGIYPTSHPSFPDIVWWWRIGYNMIITIQLKWTQSQRVNGLEGAF